MNIFRKIAILIASLTVIGLALAFVTGNFSTWASDWYNWLVDTIKSFWRP